MNMRKKALIIDLIRQDLINYNLMHTLHEMECGEVDPENHRLELSRIIFEMMNVEHLRSVETILDHYTNMLEKMQSITATHCSDKITALATEIYLYLNDERKNYSRNAVKNLKRLKSKFEILHPYLKWSVGNYSVLDPDPMEGYALYFKMRHCAYPRRFIALLFDPFRNNHRLQIFHYGFERGEESWEMIMRPTKDLTNDVPFKFKEIKMHIKDMDDEFSAINSPEDRSE